jgi:hypothetical protein
MRLICRWKCQHRNFSVDSLILAKHRIQGEILFDVRPTARSRDVGQIVDQFGSLGTFAWLDQEACLSVIDNFFHSTPAKGDHWCACGHGLDRHQAEWFVPGDGAEQGRRLPHQSPERLALDLPHVSDA